MKLCVILIILGFFLLIEANKNQLTFKEAKKIARQKIAIGDLYDTRPKVIKAISILTLEKDIADKKVPQKLGKRYLTQFKNLDSNSDDFFEKHQAIFDRLVKATFPEEDKIPKGAVFKWI
ncbi:uncharacterized protein LOC141850051 [Brevipalpus obovatus]|uniref:uncharacterized protein LOC141850051 n=1 Tax=Brevipalpus obovatus TaxID=246614 RepID=UPI003D9E14F0